MTDPPPLTARPRWQVAPARMATAALLVLAGGCGPTSRSVPVAETVLVTGVAQPATERQPDRSLSRVATLLERASLLRLDRACRTRPGLAASVTTPDEGRTWRIVLREGLTFHDGSALDARAIASILAPGSADPLFQPPGLRDIVEATATDVRTVDVRLATPSSLFLEALASLEVTGGRDGSSRAGPFTSVPDATGPGIELTAFDRYYDGRPGIRRVVLRSYPTTRTAWAALMRREIDFLYEVSPEATGFVASSGDAQIRSFVRSFVYAVGFNVNHPALRSAEVRRRFADAVDRRRLIDHVFGGRGIAAVDPVWPMHWAHDAPIDGVEADPARPQPRQPAPGPPEGGLTLRCLVPAGLPLFERLALHVQRAMLDVGVDLRLEPVPIAELSRRLARGEFETYLLDMNGFGLGWTYWLWHSTASRPFVVSGYRGADEALDAMRRAGTDAELRVRLREVRQRLQDDPPAIFLAWPLTARAVTTRFALPGGEGRDILTSLSDWQAVGEEP